MVSIDVLPDDVLLDIFDFCVDRDRSRQFTHIREDMYAWETLVHVCRRWRTLVFESPRRLNLALVCTAATPARNKLNVWPPLPLVIRSVGLYGPNSNFQAEYMDNISAVLERSDRVCQISLTNIPNSYLEPLLAATHGLPELTHLLLYSREGPIVPDSFLGGSAPLLQYILLDGILFPGLPGLLLSTTHLVDLQLRNIRHNILPEVMAITLSTLTRLEFLSIEFQSPATFPLIRQRPPPLTRSVLPVLKYFIFKGVSEYLEYLVARIDAPLKGLCVIFFNQPEYDTPQLIRFIHRTPMLKALERAHVTFASNTARVKLSSPTSGYGVTLKIPCRNLAQQVLSLTQFFTSESSLPPLSILEDLYIYNDPNSHTEWPDDVENAMWLGFLHPFPAVTNLYVCRGCAPCIVPALRELVGARTTEVLPTLQNIFLEELRSSGPIHEGIREFVAARQVTSHPIAVSLWENSEQDKILGY